WRARATVRTARSRATRPTSRSRVGPKTRCGVMKRRTTRCWRSRNGLRSIPTSSRSSRLELLSASLLAGRGFEQALGKRVQACAGAFAADALQADARPLDQQEQLFGDALRMQVSRLAAERDQAFALAALVGLHDLARRMPALGELDRGVGQRAAAAGRHGGELRHAPHQKAQLRVRVARVRGTRLVPDGFALGGE